MDGNLRHVEIPVVSDPLPFLSAKQSDPSLGGDTRIESVAPGMSCALGGSFREIELPEFLLKGHEEPGLRAPACAPVADSDVRGLETLHPIPATARDIDPPAPSQFLRSEEAPINASNWTERVDPQWCRESVYFTITRVDDGALMGCSYRCPEATLVEDTDYFLQLFMRADLLHKDIETFGDKNLRGLATYSECRHSVFTLFPSGLETMARLLPEELRCAPESTLARSEGLAILSPFSEDTSRPREVRSPAIRRPDETFVFVSQRLVYPARQFAGAGTEEFQSFTLNKGANVLKVDLRHAPVHRGVSMEVMVKPLETIVMGHSLIAPVLRARPGRSVLSGFGFE